MNKLCPSETNKVMELASLEPNVFHYSAGIVASERSHDWQRAMSMLEQMQVVEVTPNEYSFSSAMKALSAAVQWQRALHALGHLGLAQDRQSCNVMGFSAAMGACVKATQWAEAGALGVLALQPSLQRLCRPDPEEVALLEVTMEGPPEGSIIIASGWCAISVSVVWLYGYPGVPEGQEIRRVGDIVERAMAARQLLWLNPSASSVLDPFCGSGTVLIEAALAGKAATGSDASPLAAFVVRHHTDVDRISLDSLRAQARALAPDEKELSWDDLRGRLRALPEGPVTSALWFCLLVALQRAGDATSGSKGFVASQSSGDPPGKLCRPMFLGTVELYAAQLSALRSSMPFPDLVRTWAVITSPPDPGVYSYANAARLTPGWLKGAAEAFGNSEDLARMESMEIGSLSSMEMAPEKFATTWRKQQEEWLQVIWDNLLPEGTATLVLPGSD
eukprot:s1268_g6.t1